MSSSILEDTKKALGLGPEMTAFDLDILMHINGVLSTLHQLGIGPVEGLVIEDATTTWESLLGSSNLFNFVKTYVYLRVRLLFDPPGTSFLIASFEKQIQELEWRINAQRELSTVTVVAAPVFVIDGGDSIGA